MSAPHLLAPERGNVVRLSDYRSSRSDAPSAPPSDEVRYDVLATLDRCDHFVYAGVTPDDTVHFGLLGFKHVNSTRIRLGTAVISDLDYDNATNLRDAAIRLLGNLQAIIDAGDGQ
ncbi:hypothetical protein WJ79_19355 [Burkholderia ubonensis]|uniref:hypothetical protein n=1 Tax=Burkholderia ubonensis TaxID=101571 RepID=UPI000759740E|nr:hypothetical protein [Burkholderia ubonensis]KVO72417.1 hypothetical protein WJ79_19355 [Burkholderia ubonensis]